MNFRQLINGLYNWINASPNLMFMALKIDCDFKTFETDLGTERFFMQLKHRFKNIIVNCEFIKRVTSNGSEDEATILFYLPYYYGNNYIFSKPDTILSCELNYYEELPLIFYRRFYNSILDFVDPIVLCCGYEKEECKDMYKEEPKENNWLKNSVIEKEFKELNDNEKKMTKEEAIKKLEHYRYCLKFQYGWYDKDDDEAIDMAIKALEKTRWIPVSERLPEEAKRVLLYAERDAYDNKGKFRKEVIDIGWQVDGRWHIDGCNGVDGIAWIPLPKPYKTESEDKKWQEH